MFPLDYPKIVWDKREKKGKVYSFSKVCVLEGIIYFLKNGFCKNGLANGRLKCLGLFD